MKIVTCLKEVPGRETRYQVDSGQSWIDESGVTLEINECDEYALEEALKLQEKHGGEVTILSIGRTRSEKSIRKGLAMGAQRAILVVDEGNRVNSPHAAASVLAQALGDQEYDLILAGTQSDDYSYAQTGTILAELLGLPHATIVMEIEASPERGKVKALREMEAGWFQWVEMPLPAVLTIQAGISRPRYLSLKGIMQARKKEIRRVSLDGLGLNLDSLPHLEVTRLYFEEAGSNAEILQGDTVTVVNTLVEKLRKEARVL